MGFREYLAKRIIVSFLVIFLVATLNFLIFIVYPADPTRYLLDPQLARTPGLVDVIRDQYGLNEPLHVKYVKYLGNMFSFGILPPHFGYSFQTHDFVANEMAWRMPLTILLLGLALVGNVIIGIPLGIFAASRRGTKTDVAVIGAGLFTYGVPTFFVQLLMILFFISFVYQTYGIKIFPAGGWISYPNPEGLINVMGDILWHMALPALTLVVAGFAGWALYTRNMLVDALTQDYVATARAKGLSERTILFKHAFKSIHPQVATLLTLSLPGLVTGAIITETIFGLEGVGKWYLSSLDRSNPDFPVVQAVLFVVATLVVVCNLVADLLYGVLDPRIRVGQRR
ncbi:MAG: ABC transporter permease [Candidatus Bathyarchaeota archaeon]|nr:MAG: ABC transporter permease [Candidatus Bathyarchaeota archaeon]